MSHIVLITHRMEAQEVVKAEKTQTAGPRTPHNRAEAAAIMESCRDPKKLSQGYEQRPLGVLEYFMYKMKCLAIW